MKRSLLALSAGGLLLALTGCGTSGPTAADAGSVSVSAAFYPLAYAVERVGGEHVTVSNLAKPGAEPHDVELTPKDVAALRGADLVVYERGFQPAVDAAVADVDSGRSLDVSTAVDLTLEATDDGHEHAGDDSGHEKADPHFWLDPTRYASAVTAISTRLGKVDPANSTAYTQNAHAFVGELTTLDEEFAAGLKDCTNRDLVTGHAAFAYLAERYDLHQEGIAGLSPDSEPTAATMKSIVEHVRDHGVSTIYAETLANTDLTETIAKETGATVAVLDPIEGLNDASAGTNYLEVMRSNLATLTKGQGCP